MRLAVSFLLMLAAGAGAVDPNTDAGKAEGTSTAPVRIEVFSDYQCPMCKTFHEQTLPALRDDYIVKNKVYLVNREFPLPMHAHSKQAAALATAAARNGKYIEVSNAMFATQLAWSASGKVEDAAVKDLKPPVAAKIRALSKEPSIAAEVERDLKLGQSFGVDRTPTLIIMHKGRRYPISGTINYNLLKRLIDDLLTK